MASSSIVGILRVLLTANTAEFEAGMKSAATTADNWKKSLTSIGKQAEAVGQTLTATLTVPILGVGGAAVKMAADYQSAFANVKKTVDDDTTPEQLKSISEGLREMSQVIPVSAAELANIAAMGAQFGIATEGLLGFTRTIADLGVAVDGISAADAAEGLAQFAKVTGTADADIGRLASSLVELGNKGSSTEGVILEFAKRLGGAGHQIGLTAPQIMGVGAAMANLGINAEAGGSAMSKVMSKMEGAVARGGEALEKFAAVAGYTGPDAAKRFADTFRTEPIKALDEFISGLGKTKDAGQSLTLVLDDMEMKDTRLVDALKRLASAQGEVKTQTDLSTAAAAEGNKHTKEAEEKYKTFWNQLQLVKNELTDVGITFGAALLPALRNAIEALRPFLEGLGAMAQWFAELPAPAQNTALAIAAIFAAIGPSLWMFGAMAQGLSSILALFGQHGVITTMTTAMRGYIVATEAGTVATYAMNAAMGAGIIGLVVALGLALKEVGEASRNLYRHWQDGKPMWDFFAARDEDNWVRKWTGLGTVFDSFVTRVQGADKTGLAPLQARLIGTTTAFAPLVSGLTAAGAAAGETFAPGLNAASEAAKQHADEIKKLQDALFGRDLITRANNMIEALGGVNNIAKLSEEQKKALKKAVDDAIAAYERLGQKAPQALRDVSAATTPLLTSTVNLSRAYEPLQESVADAGTEIRNLAAGFTATGEIGTRSFEDMEAASRDAARQLEEFTRRGGALAPTVQQVRVEIEEAEDATKSWSQVLGDSLQNFPKLLTQAFTGGGGFGGAIKGLFADIGGSLFGAQGPIGGMLKNLGGSLAGMFGSSGIGQAIGGALGSIVPGLGTALGSMIGPLIGKLGSAIGGLFGGVSKEVKQARQEVEQFQQGLAQTLNATQRAEAGGERWKMTVIAVRDAYLATGRTAAEADTIVKQLWDTDHPERARAAMEQINTVLEEQKQHVADLEAEYEALTEEAEGYQSELDALTAESEFNWQKMQEAAQRYGVDLASLGPTFQSGRLHETAQQIWDDFVLLTRGGADVGGVLLGMKDEIISLAQQAVQFGVQIPDNFKPLIDNLIHSEQLTEEEKASLLALGETNFGDPIVSALDAIALRMEELVGLLADIAGRLATHVPAAAATAGSSIASSMRDRAIPALEDTAAAVDSVIQMSSPTGLEGIAVYAQLASMEMKKMAQVADEKMKALAHSVDSVSQSLVGVIHSMGDLGSVQVAPEIALTATAAGTHGGEVLTEADAIEAVNRALAAHGAAPASQDLLNALAKATGYTGGGNISAELLDNLLDRIAQGVPQLAEGGIVDQPTLAMIGEGGEPEAVMPLSHAESSGFGGASADMVAGIGQHIDRLMARYDMTMRITLRDAMAGAI